MFLSGGAKGKPIFQPFAASAGFRHSLRRGPLPPSKPEVWHLWISCCDPDSLASPNIMVQFEQLENVTQQAEIELTSYSREADIKATEIY